MERLIGKTILVTGGTGFVGSHLVEALLTLGATVIVPYRSRNPRSYFFTKKLDRKAVMVNCDVKDFQRIFDVVTKYEIDVIFHLAAQSIVPIAYCNPLETLETNIMGTVNLLESARLFGNVQAIIVASSDKAYGKSDTLYKETDPLRGDHPYEASKSCEDLIAQTYVKTYNMPIVVTRFANIYGPGDLNISRIIPGFMKAIITREVLKLRSNGMYIRDYIYVKDVVSACLFLLKHKDKAVGEAFNISTPESYSVQALLKKMECELNKKVRYSINNTSINEIPYQHLSNEKMNRLGWKSRYSFRRAIRETYQWYKNNMPF